MDQNVIFQHQPLSEEHKEIRLLSINKLSGPSHILLKIEIVRLDDVYGRFEAVSYAWGTSELRFPVLLNNQTYFVGESISDFLRHACSHRPLRKRFWIDAICINQHDPMEKGWQVAMMGKLYASASRVLVWQGNTTAGVQALASYQRLQEARQAAVAIEAADNAASAVTGPGFRERVAPLPVSREALAKRHKERKEELLQQVSMAAFQLEETLQTFIHVAYWQRLWIVQEIRLAQSAVIIAGDAEIDLETVVQYGPKSAALDRFSKAKVYQQDLSLLIRAYYTQLCSDPRDRIYGLLSMSNCNDMFPVDYTIGREELFGKALEVTKARSLWDAKVGETRREDVIAFMNALQVSSESLRLWTCEQARLGYTIGSPSLQITLRCIYVLTPCFKSHETTPPINHLSRLASDNHESKPRCFKKRNLEWMPKEYAGYSDVLLYCRNHNWDAEFIFTPYPDCPLILETVFIRGKYHDLGASFKEHFVGNFSFGTPEVILKCSSVGIAKLVEVETQ